MEHHDVLQALTEPTKSLRHAAPAVWAGFSALHEAAMADGVVPRHTKEAVALALSVVKRCDGCIAYHARAAEQAGASAEEVAELLGVALLMDGGTASVDPHAPGRRSTSSLPVASRLPPGDPHRVTFTRRRSRTVALPAWRQERGATRWRTWATRTTC